MRGMPCEGRLSTESLVRCKGVDAQERIGTILGQVCGKKLGKIRGLSLTIPSFFIGDGSRVSFRKDIWCEEEALCRSFPTLFSLAILKEAVFIDCNPKWIEEKLCISLIRNKLFIYKTIPNQIRNNTKFPNSIYFYL